MSKINQSGLIAQLVKYGLVGVVNTLITFLVIYILQELLGMTPALSNAIGYTAGLLNSFLMNSRWTFESERSWKRFLLFMLVWLPCYGANLLALHLLLSYTSFPAIWCQIVAMLVFNILNFVLNKLITFRR